MRFMVLRVRPSPTLFPAKILYTQLDKHTLAFCTNCLTAVGLLLLFRHSAKSSIAEEERLATSPWLVTRLGLPHTMEGGHR